MTKLPLPVRGGGILEIHGSPEARKIIVIVGRDASHQDETVIARIIAYFEERGITVACYESWDAETFRLITPPWIAAYPRLIRRATKILLLLANPARWPYLRKKSRLERSTIAYRAEALLEAIRFLKTEREVFLLTRSAGGRIASLVADAAGANKLACLGYPFENPKEGVNPARFAHLPEVHTPFLILQGTRDPYGGREIDGKYTLSPQTSLEWVDTDHEFQLSDQEWNRVLPRLEGFFFPENKTAKTQRKAGV
ncbi:MAG TPA: alpha/beta family hydrolase [Chthoniobacterales bacterium]|nr:alpha/beta family hydrolase [Chthoniobacterales bacterium]